MSQFLKVYLKTSAICRTQKQKDTLRGLGLRKLHQTRVLKNTPAIRGLVQKVIHLVEFEETDTAELKKTEKVVSYKLGKVAASKSKAASKKVVAKEVEAKKVVAKKAEAKEAPPKSKDKKADSK